MINTRSSRFGHIYSLGRGALFLLSLLFIVVNSVVFATDADSFDAAPFKVRVEIKPEVPKVGKNQVTIWVDNDLGQPVAGAVLSVVAVMPAMGSMPAMYAPAEMNETAAGRYEGEFEPSMGGEWPLTIEIETSTAKGSITFDLAIGRKGLRCVTCGGEGANVPGTVRVDPARRQLIGITTGRVKQKKLRIATRASGVITYDETRLSDVALKFNGWIGELHANAIGKAVEKGKPLFSVYSPELLTVQEEYLAALHRASGNAGQSKEWLVAARRKLRLWDLTAEQIVSLENRDSVQEYVTILAPDSGVVIDKQVVTGSAFRAGQSLLRIADLSQVWAEAQVYDYELPLIKIGMKARVVLPQLQNREYLATVGFIYPFAQGDTHTTRIRVVLNNSDGFLRPDMYAEIKLLTKLGKRLVVPESAVLYSGQSRIVFLDLGDGRLVPRKIKTGQRSRDYIEVLDGLEEGDTVVTSGNFLIAAESKLKAGVDAW